MVPFPLEKFAMFSHKDLKGDKSGIALIIVLALLALLMIVSASFLFTMRIERAGAANNRHDWVANQVAHAGLDYAMASIDHFFLNSDKTSWNDDSEFYWKYDSGKRKFTLHPDTFVSLREDLSENQAKDDAAPAKSFIPLGSTACEFLPPALAYRGSANELFDRDGNSIAKIDPPEWIPVRPFGKLDDDTVNRGGKEDKGERNPVIGRYTFMAFDTTGMVDVNNVMTNSHDWGQSSGEIQLDHETFAADFKASKTDDRTLSDSNVKKFMDVRDDDGAYVSLQNMAALNDYFDYEYSSPHGPLGRMRACSPAKAQTWKVKKALSI